MTDLKESLKIKIPMPAMASSGLFAWWDLVVKPEIDRINKLIDDGERLCFAKPGDPTNVITEEALLIGKRPIARCEHKKIGARWPSGHICNDCNKQVEPTGWKEV